MKYIATGIYAALALIGFAFLLGFTQGDEETKAVQRLVARAPAPQPSATAWQALIERGQAMTGMPK